MLAASRFPRLHQPDGLAHPSPGSGVPAVADLRLDEPLQLRGRVMFMGGPLSYWLCPANRRSYSVGFDFVAALLRLLGRFRDFEAALLRTAGIFCPVRAWTLAAFAIPRVPYAASFVQIPSKLLISKTAAEPCSSDCQCSCDLNRSAARCDVPRTFG